MDTSSPKGVHALAAGPAEPYKPAKSSAQTGSVIRILPRVPLKFRVQRAICWMSCLPFCGLIAFLLRWVGRYRFEDMSATREDARRLLSQPGPIVVCSNHLTFIDSILLIWAFAGNAWYFRHYNRFTWNLPAGDVFSKKLLFRVVAYLGKCIFVYRDGTHRHKGEIVALAKTLVSKEEVLTIFPEGRRSRSGRFEIERLTSGAAKIITEVPGCRVLCTYLRGDRQDSHSEYPPRGSRFFLELKEIRPTFTPGDRNAVTDVTRQIGETIREMEDRYFKNRPEAVKTSLA